MLTMFPLKDAKAASEYYGKDNYYAKEEAKQSSEWWGNGADKLNLSGIVELEDFEKLLQGTLPNCKQLGRVTEDGIQHRPGYDLTFSAPKSVSMMSEIAGDERIIGAHKIAVQETMQFMQKNAILTRRMIDNEIVFEPVDNLAVAMFHHNTSRALDPNLHTHCVVLNAVERSDEAWRSISSELMYDYKMTGGVYYRSVLSNKLQSLGYEIEKTGPDGTFEIKGISREQIEVFSKRRQKIVEEMDIKGWEGAKAASVVTLNTREKKKTLNSQN